MAACQASVSFTISHGFLKLMAIESMMSSNQLILCYLLLLPSIFPSISVFSNKLALCISWPKDWCFSFSIRTSNKYSGFISFRIDWFILLAVQGTLKSLLQYYNLKASILQHSAFFMVQLSYLYMTTGKTIALTIWTFVSKIMSLIFNLLSRFVIAFLPRGRHLLISWLQSPSTVILEPKKMKFDSVSTFSSSIWHEVIGADAMIFIFWMLNFKPAFSPSSFTFIKRLFSSSSHSAIKVVSSAYLRLLIILSLDLVIVVQLLSRVWLFVTPRIAARQASQPFPAPRFKRFTSSALSLLYQYQLEFEQIHSIFVCFYRVWRGTKKPLDESERGEWKNWIKIQHSGN